LAKEGNANLAAQYSDPAKVRPEIYVKGTRNAYTITLDPVRRWLTWGDVGPDQHKVSEEYNLVKEPFYMGWPYFAGEETMAGVSPYGTPIPAGSTHAAPLNSHASAGIKQLPPLREPIFKRPEGCAMTGPIFRYDGVNKSASQFPPQFNRKWLVSGCDTYGFHLYTLDEAGESVINDLKLFERFTMSTMVDLKQGPDGAVYYVNYRYGIDVIRYKGVCKDDALLPETPTAVAEVSAIPAGGILAVRGQSLEILTQGFYEIRFLGLDGREAAVLTGHGPKSYGFPARLGKGVYQVLVQTESGIGKAMLIRF
jgi:hypothetical protein